MLGLHYQTPATWARQALARPADLLLDHYFCEVKAAAMALRTRKLFGARCPALHQLMQDLAAEEDRHAEQVQCLLKAYSRPQAAKGGNRYAQGLRKLAAPSGNVEFLDMLLVCGLIEARSAERFRLLADAARGSTLGSFYEDLYASEVNHYLLFTGLGADFCGADQTLARLDILRASEAALIESLPPGPRIH